MRHTIHLYHCAGAALCLVAACAEDPQDPGPEDTDEPCFRGLADLSGDGVLDELDCDLRGTGAAIRAFCVGDPTSWITNAACRGSRQSLILDDDVAEIHATQYNSVGMFVIRSFNGGRIWYDANGSGIVDVGERSDMTGVSDSSVVAMRQAGRGLLVLTRSHAWLDFNMNGSVEAAELVAVSAISGVPAPAEYGAAIGWWDTQQGSVTVLAFLTGSSIFAWADLDRDWQVDAGEVATLTGRGVIGFTAGTAGRPALVYEDNAYQLRYWGGDDWSFDSAEVVAWSSQSDCRAQLVGSDPYTCTDSRGRTVYKLQWQEHHVSFARQPQAVGFTSGPLTGGWSVPFARLASSGPQLWLDLNNDGDQDSNETIRLSLEYQTGEGAVVDSLAGFAVGVAVVQVPESSGQRRVLGQAVYPSSSLAFLGEECEDAADPPAPTLCASSLVCRVSGEDTQSRCTFAPP